MTEQTIGQEPVWRLRGRAQLVPVKDALIARISTTTIRLPHFGPVEERILHLLADGSTEGYLLDRLGEGSDADRRRAGEIFQLLKDNGFLEVLHEPSDLLPEDLARFDRLVHMFSELELGGESRYDRLGRLLNVRVGVIGVGGMGSWILYGLACCGIRDFVLMDADRVEASNLNRSILFREEDIGRPKVEAAAEALTRFSPRARVHRLERRADGPEDLRELVEGVDLVVGAADQPAWLIRRWLAEACRTAKVPLIHPSGLRVGPFYYPGTSACPMCEWAEHAAREPRFPEVVAAMRRLPRGNSGGLAPWASATASITVMEVFRHVAGFGPVVTRDALWEMGADYVGRLRPLKPHPDCPVCHGEGGASTC
ncbi:ThiF family adenylyltransferase [Nonomuraea sp. NPDC049141]|uniref:HesA/MoeB/ThiF family protein n=1 Tax=Nonomuraea sp. NPDC049141 TaxID=3155500 RepID=UPI0033F86FD8